MTTVTLRGAAASDQNASPSQPEHVLAEPGTTPAAGAQRSLPGFLGPLPSSWLPSLGSLDRRSLLPFACWPDEQLTEHTSEQIHKQTDAQTHEEIGASGYHNLSNE